MSDSEIQSVMEFILNQQAASAARMEQLENVVLRLANATEGRVSNLEDKVSMLVDAQIKTETVMQQVGEAQKKLTAAQEELNESFKHTDERLNALIDIVIDQRDDKADNEASDKEDG